MIARDVEFKKSFVQKLSYPQILVFIKIFVVIAEKNIYGGKLKNFLNW